MPELKFCLLDIESNNKDIRSIIARDLLLRGDYSISVDSNKSNILTRNKLLAPYFWYVSEKFYISIDEIERDNIDLILLDNTIVSITDDLSYKLYMSTGVFFILTDFDLNVKCIFTLDFTFKRYFVNGIWMKLDKDSIHILLDEKKNLYISFNRFDFSPEGVFSNNTRLDINL